MLWKTVTVCDVFQSLPVAGCDSVRVSVCTGGSQSPVHSQPAGCRLLQAPSLSPAELHSISICVYICVSRPGSCSDLRSPAQCGQTRLRESKVTATVLPAAAAAGNIKSEKYFPSSSHHHGLVREHVLTPEISPTMSLANFYPGQWSEGADRQVRRRIHNEFWFSNAKWWVLMHREQRWSWTDIRKSQMTCWFEKFIACNICQWLRLDPQFDTTTTTHKPCVSCRIELS